MLVSIESLDDCSYKSIRNILKVDTSFQVWTFLQIIWHMYPMHL